MREVKAGEQLFTEEEDPDKRERLLFNDEFAGLLKIDLSTLRGYHSAARAARRKRRPAHFPAPDEYVRRISIKSNGQPVAAVTPAWRESKATHYATHRLGPGGRPRKGGTEGDYADVGYTRALPAHNHVTRDVKPQGQCPGCDASRIDEAG